MRPYADRMQELMVGTARAASSFRNLALMQRRDVHRVAFVVVTGDRGLAGPFNGQVLRRAFELERQERAEGHEVVWTVVGRKGASTLRFRRYELTAQWAGFADKPTYADAQAIAHRLAELYTERAGRPRRARLQPLRVGARAARDDRRPAADPRGGAREPDRT